MHEHQPLTNLSADVDSVVKGQLNKNKEMLRYICNHPLTIHLILTAKQYSLQGSPYNYEDNCIWTIDSPQKG